MSQQEQEQEQQDKHIRELSLDENLFGPKQSFSKQIFCPKKIWVQNNF